MFLILQDESFNKKKNQKKGPKRNHENSTRYIIGTKFRSKTGCLVCRKKKRKCDECHPICKFCQSRGLHCSYLDDLEMSRQNSQDGSSSSSNAPIITEVNNISQNEFVVPTITQQSILNPSLSTPGNYFGIPNVPHIISDFPDDPSEDIDNFALTHSVPSYFNMNRNPISNGTSVVNGTPIVNGSAVVNGTPNMNGTNMNGTPVSYGQPNIIYPLGMNYDFDINYPYASPTLTVPSSLPSLCLDAKGLQYFEYFNFKVSKILSIGSDSHNHFSQVFYTLAHNQEAFLYALTSWAAVYRGKEHEVKFYLKKAVNKLNEYVNNNNDDDMALYFKLCFYTILFAYFICLGDTDRWYKIVTESANMIRARGGLKSVCQIFNYSHEIRFIVSNIQYSDIMGSKCHKLGPLFSAKEYEELYAQPEFKNNELSYGVDSLQGVSQSILTILSNVIELKIEITSKLTNLNGLTNQDDYLDYKIKCFDQLNQDIVTLEQKIEDCQPNVLLLNLLKPDSPEHKLSEMAFTLYKLITTLYFNLYVKRIPPTNIVNQVLVQKLLKMIDFLSGTRFCVILCLPLLMVGVCCVNDFDKANLIKRFTTVKTISPVLNIEKVWIIVQKCWQLNDGNHIIDWADICEEYGWCLNVC